MGVALDYKDVLNIYSTQLSADGYGTEFRGDTANVNGLFLVNTGWQHTNFQTNTTSDAEAYLDPNNEFIKSRGYRIEGMYITYQREGEDGTGSWYKITQVIVGEDKLLGNGVDNVNVQLKKSSEVPNL